MGAAKRKSKTSPSIPKRAKSEEIPVYSDQDPFDDYDYGNGGEDDAVAESDVVQDGGGREDDSGMDEETWNNEVAPQRVSQDVSMTQGTPGSSGVPMSQAKRGRGRPLGKKWSTIWDHFNISEAG